MDVVYGIIISLVSGVVSAFIFFMMLRLFRPNIEISNEIVRFTEDGKEKHKFKFINKTRSSVVNVSIRMFLIEEYKHGTGKNFTQRKVLVNTEKIDYLVGTSEKDPEKHDNCIQMTILNVKDGGPLKDEWNKREWLYLYIDCEHSQSGRRKVFLKKYPEPNLSIVNGYFDSGENFNIIKDI